MQKGGTDSATSIPVLVYVNNQRFSSEEAYLGLTLASSEEAELKIKTEAIEVIKIE